MPHTAEQITAMHNALMRGCQHPQLRMTSADHSLWRDFLSVMEPLEDTPGGPITASDIVTVLGTMQAHNNKARLSGRGYQYSLRPSSILRDPEKIRDLILESRRTLRKRPPPIMRQVNHGTGNRMIEHDPADDTGPRMLASEVSSQLAAFRARQRRSATGSAGFLPVPSGILPDGSTRQPI